MTTLTIDGKTMQVRPGTTVLECALGAQLDARLDQRWRTKDGNASGWEYPSTAAIMDEVACWKEAPANLLTQDFALDPLAKIPEYKVCAVRLERPRSGSRGRSLPPAAPLSAGTDGPSALPSREQPAG